MKNLKKRYDEFTLDDVSFSLEEGTITGFIGINGSGKTTTIRSILGLCNIDKGIIEFNNKNIFDNELYFKNNIGVVLDKGYFYDNLSIAKMASIVSPAYKNWSDNEFNFYLKKLGLNPKQKIHTLSKGMETKFAFALALSHKPKLLIMDEPTSGLDPLVREEILEILQEYVTNKNGTVFFSTHITSDLDKIADKLIMINKGRIILDESLDNLQEKYDFENVSPSVEELMLFFIKGGQ